MVLADSPRVSRVPGYSGSHSGALNLSLTGLSPSLVGLSSPVQVNRAFVTTVPGLPSGPSGPATPMLQRRQAITQHEFRLVPVRSPLLGESLSCFPFLGLLRCFNSPACLNTPIDSVCRHWPSRQWGSPIRNPRDQRLLTAPPGLSWPATSFFGIQRLGIPRAPLVV